MDVLKIFKNANLQGYRELNFQLPIVICLVLTLLTARSAKAAVDPRVAGIEAIVQLYYGQVRNETRSELSLHKYVSTKDYFMSNDFRNDLKNQKFGLKLEVEGVPIGFDASDDEVSKFQKKMESLSESQLEYYIIDRYSKSKLDTELGKNILSAIVALGTASPTKPEEKTYADLFTIQQTIHKDKKTVDFYVRYTRPPMVSDATLQLASMTVIKGKLLTTLKLGEKLDNGFHVIGEGTEEEPFCMQLVVRFKNDEGCRLLLNCNYDERKTIEIIAAKVPNQNERLFSKICGRIPALATPHIDDTKRFAK